MNNNDFLLIDISNIMYRSYFQTENKQMRTSKGFPVNMVFNCLQRIVDIYSYLPSKYVAIVFDNTLNFRKQIFLEKYKQNRAEKEKDMLAQIPLIEPILKANGLCCVNIPYFEADDVIASLTKNLYLDKINVIIVSTDKDLMQLVDDEKNISFFNLTDNQIYKEQQVKEHFGIEPKLLNDYLCLVGDSSDNIDGVTGWGAKTTAKYLNQFENLENLYKFCANLDDENTENIKDFKKFITLKNSLNTLNLNKNLIKLNDNLIYFKNMNDYELKKPNLKFLNKLTQILEFEPIIDFSNL